MRPIAKPDKQPLPSKLALQAIRKGRLSDSDRARLPTSILTLLAMGGYLQLTMNDRFRLPKAALIQLTIAKIIKLTRRERDRFNPAILAQLVVGGHIHLDEDEFLRL